MKNRSDPPKGSFSGEQKADGLKYRRERGICITHHQEFVPEGSILSWKTVL